MSISNYALRHFKEILLLMYFFRKFNNKLKTAAMAMAK